LLTYEKVSKIRSVVEENSFPCVIDLGIILFFTSNTEDWLFFIREGKEFFRIKKGAVGTAPNHQRRMEESVIKLRQFFMTKPDKFKKGRGRYRAKPPKEDGGACNKASSFLYNKALSY